ncbi:MAG: hypothetical protein D6798_20115 [Deltaproteobacteria bacterium]|nr:MAG: hypothetical protein D6798_20115 [Deltaproteobacteria bacterium]
MPFLLSLLSLLTPARAGALNIQYLSDGTVIVLSQLRNCDCDDDPKVPRCGPNEIPPDGVPCPDSGPPVINRIDSDDPGPIWEPGTWITFSLGLDDAGQIHVIMGEDRPKLRRGRYTRLEPVAGEEARAWVDDNMVLDAESGHLLLDVGIVAQPETFDGKVIGADRVPLILAPAEGRLLEVSPDVEVSPEMLETTREVIDTSATVAPENAVDEAATGSQR